MSGILLMPFTAKSVLLFHILQSKGESVSGFFDNDASILGMRYENHPITTPHDAGASMSDIQVILCEPRHYSANEEQLVRLGYRHIQRFEHALVKGDVERAIPLINADLFAQIAPKQAKNLQRLPWVIKQYILPENAKRDDALILDILDILVTEKCTLRCAKCANLMQYFKNPQHMPFEQVCRDIDLTFDKIDFVRNLYIFGGEALMYKQFREVLEYAQRYKDRYGLIRTTTNGTIVPDEDTLQAMQEYEMFVEISHYGALSRNADVLICRLDEYHINYTCTTMRWFEYQQLVDGEGRDAAQIFSTCKEKCATLRNGLLYRCPFLAHAETLCAMPYSEYNHVDMGDERVQKQDLAAYMTEPACYKRPVPPGCAYCSGYDVGYVDEIPVAEQADTPLSYVRFDKNG